MAYLVEASQNPEYTSSSPAYFICGEDAEELKAYFGSLVLGAAAEPPELEVDAASLLLENIGQGRVDGRSKAAFENIVADREYLAYKRKDELTKAAIVGRLTTAQYFHELSLLNRQNGETDLFVTEEGYYCSPYEGVDGKYYSLDVRDIQEYDEFEDDADKVLGLAAECGFDAFVFQDAEVTASENGLTPPLVRKLPVSYTVLGNRNQETGRFEPMFTMLPTDYYDAVN